MEDCSKAHLVEPKDIKASVNITPICRSLLAAIDKCKENEAQNEKLLSLISFLENELEEEDRDPIYDNGEYKSTLEAIVKSDTESIIDFLKEMLSSIRQNHKNNKVIVKKKLEQLLSTYRNEEMRLLLEEELEFELKSPVECFKSYCTFLDILKDGSKYVENDRVIFANLRRMTTEGNFHFTG